MVTVTSNIKTYSRIIWIILPQSLLSIRFFIPKALHEVKRLEIISCFLFQSDLHKQGRGS